MTNKLKLHHCAKRIAPGSLDFVMGLFNELECQESYREDGATWAMIEQDGRMIVQLIETDQKPQKTNEKRNSHIAFLSDDPQAKIERIKNWTESQGKEFVKGEWSEKELYFDCPEVFIDFVIEIMHTSIIDK